MAQAIQRNLFYPWFVFLVWGSAVLGLFDLTYDWPAGWYVLVMGAWIWITMPAVVSFTSDRECW